MGRPYSLYVSNGGIVSIHRPHVALLALGVAIAIAISVIIAADLSPPAQQRVVLTGAVQAVVASATCRDLGDGDLEVRITNAEHTAQVGVQLAAGRLSELWVQGDGGDPVGAPAPAAGNLTYDGRTIVFDQARVTEGDRLVVLDGEVPCLAG